MLSLRSVICKACQEQLLKTRLLISNLTGKWFMCAFRFPLVSYYQHPPCPYYLTFMSTSYRVVGAALNETQNLSHPVGNPILFNILGCIDKFWKERFSWLKNFQNFNLLKCGYLLCSSLFFSLISPCKNAHLEPCLQYPTSEWYFWQGLVLYFQLFATLWK